MSKEREKMKTKAITILSVLVIFLLIGYYLVIIYPPQQAKEEIDKFFEKLPKNVKAEYGDIDYSLIKEQLIVKKIVFNLIDPPRTIEINRLETKGLANGSELEQLLGQPDNPLNEKEKVLIAKTIKFNGIGFTNKETPDRNFNISSVVLENLRAKQIPLGIFPSFKKFKTLTGNQKEQLIDSIGFEKFQITDVNFSSKESSSEGEMTTNQIALINLEKSQIGIFNIKDLNFNLDGMKRKIKVGAVSIEKVGLNNFDIFSINEDDIGNELPRIVESINLKKIHVSEIFAQSSDNDSNYTFQLKEFILSDYEKKPHPTSGYVPVSFNIQFEGLDFKEDKDYNVKIKKFSIEKIGLENFNIFLEDDIGNDLPRIVESINLKKIHVNEIFTQSGDDNFNLKEFILSDYEKKPHPKSGYVPVSFDIQFKDLEIPNLDTIENNDVKDFLDYARYRKIFVNAGINYNWTLDQKTFEIPKLSLGISDVGKIELVLKLSNFGSDMLFNFENLISSASLDYFEFGYWDSSLIKNGFEYAAKKQNTNVEIIKGMIIQGITEEKNKTTDPLFDKSLGNLIDFVKSPMSLALVARPKTPVTFENATSLFADPGSFVQSLGISLEVNQKNKDDLTISQ
jgi:hypothetical protein